MNNAVICFDINNECVYANERALKIFNSSLDSLSGISEDVQGWIKEHDTNNSASLEWSGQNMATMNLYAELLSELGTIGNDESLLRKVLSAVKALKKEKEARHTEPPCCYTAEEIEQRATAAIQRYAHGEYATNDEMLKRTERWK